MKIDIKKTITLTIIGTLILAIAIEGRDVNKEVKQVRVPTNESRKISKLGTYKYISVEDFAKRYKVTEKEIFKILKIDPKAGDEKLPLERLGKKYGKSQDEMRKNIKQLVELLHKRGKRK